MREDVNKERLAPGATAVIFFVSLCWTEKKGGWGGDEIILTRAFFLLLKFASDR